MEVKKTTGKGPAFRLRSELFKEGREEELVNRLLTAEVTTTLEELLQLSPKLFKILQWKNKNRRVPTHNRKKKIYWSEVAEDGETEKAEQGPPVSFLS